MTPLPEVWLRGPIATIPPLLQPVAHALLQATDEIETNLTGFPDEWLWRKPGGVASVGFHLQHLTGVLDRTFTYARGETLSEAQRHALAQEGTSPTDATTVGVLILAFNRQVETALAQLANTNEATLTEARGVGRAQLPSTVSGLLFHAAEHTMRHVGQLLVTVRLLPYVVEDDV